MGAALSRFVRQVSNTLSLELRYMFTSPVAWVMLIVFYCLVVVSLSEHLARFDNWQVMGLFRPVSQAAFDGDGGLPASALNYLYLFVPLVTMGAISREKQSGSLLLVQSSPVGLWEMLLGKYLAIFAYFSLFALIVLLMVVGVGTVTPNLDYGPGLTGVLAILLAAAGYSAIGLFGSCLSRYQVVCAVITLAIVSFLQFVINMAPGVPVVSDVAYAVSILTRTTFLTQGLVRSSDVLYFASVVAVFLSLAHVWVKYDGVKAVHRVASWSIAILMTGALVVYLGSDPRRTLYYDATHHDRNTVTEPTEALLRQVSAKSPEIQVSTYVDVLSNQFWFLSPMAHNQVEAQLDRYVRFAPNMVFDYRYYFSELTPQHRESIGDIEASKLVSVYRLFHPGLSRYDVHHYTQSEDVDAALAESERFRSFSMLGTGDKSEIIRYFPDSFIFPRESEWRAALIRLVESSVRLGVYQGEYAPELLLGERSPYVFALTRRDRRAALINQGFDSVSVDAGTNLSEAADVLVVIASQPYFSERDLSVLSSYIEAGGDAIILGEASSMTQLNPLLTRLGIEPGGSVEDSGYTTTYIDTPDGGLVDWRGVDDPAMPVTMDNAVSLQVIPDTVFEASSILSYRGETGEADSSSPIGYAITRAVGDQQQKVVVVGDTSFFTEAELARRTISISNRETATNNNQLIDSILRWMTDGRLPPLIERPEPRDQRINIGGGHVRAINLIGVYAMTGLLSLYAGWILYRRRRL